MLLTCLFNTGCATRQRDQQLDEVAKEWSRVIRASQVIPVYPLTEDLQPGDCFIVEVPTEDEQEIWKRQGFLPLTHHVARLRPELADQHFRKQYHEGQYGIPAEGAPVPWVWQRPRNPAEHVPTYTGVVVARPAGKAAWLPTMLMVRQNPPTYRERTHWEDAPRAAFPSFTVEVDLKSGASGSVPLQGIPLGLALLNADNAYATVTLKDAFTYGFDASAVNELVDKLRTRQGNGLLPLHAYEPRPRWNGDHYEVRYSFLRIITRVYCVGSVNTSVNQTTRTSLGAELFRQRGSDADKTPPTTQQINQWQREQNLLAAASAARGGPAGGSLELVSRNQRSVSLNETFDRPLVVGYLSVDIPIGPRGEIRNVYMGTQQRLETGRYASVDEWAALHPTAVEELVNWLAIDENLTWTFRHVPAVRRRAEERKLIDPGTGALNPTEWCQSRANLSEPGSRRPPTTSPSTPVNLMSLLTTEGPSNPADKAVYNYSNVRSHYVDLAEVLRQRLSQSHRIGLVLNPRYTRGGDNYRKVRARIYEEVVRRPAGLHYYYFPENPDHLQAWQAATRPTSQSVSPGEEHKGTGKFDTWSGPMNRGLPPM